MKTRSYLHVLILLITTNAFANYSYDLIDLGAISGGISQPSSINDSGQIVGQTYNIFTGYNRAILFDTTGTGNNTDLGTLGGTWSSAYSINNNGQIAGRAQNSSSGLWYATIFDNTGAGQNIAVGPEDSIACSINNQGKIVGEWGSRATLFDETGNGNHIQLGTLGGIKSSAAAINDNGQIVGWAYNSANISNATLFDPTGNGNNIRIGYGMGSAYSINESGQIVGVEGGHATIFDPTGNGNNIDLDPFGVSDSWACSNNDLGQIVGLMSPNGYGIGVLFDPTGNGNNIDLNALIEDSALYDTDRIGWVIDTAVGINNNGWITAIAYYYDLNTDTMLMQDRAVLLSPASGGKVPEPSTIVFLALGALALYRQKK